VRSLFCLMGILGCMHQKLSQKSQLKNEEMKLSFAFS
jgi:hypothetical protein